MKTIYKFPVYIASRNQIMMPQGAQILSIQHQGPELYLWALVDTTQDLVPRVINILGTGHPIVEEPGTYITSLQSPPFVWHFFDGGEV